MANQRGSVGKTTAAVNLAWYFAQNGRRTLLIDTDSQGSVGVMLNLKPKNYFAQFLVHKFHLDESSSGGTPKKEERRLRQRKPYVSFEALLRSLTGDLRALTSGASGTESAIPRGL